MTRTKAILLMCALALCAISCKKDDDDKTEYKYIDGTVSFGSLPEYIRQGQHIVFTVTGGSRDDGGNIGYSWTVTPFKTEADTLKKETDPADGTYKFNFTVPTDTLCSFTITVRAFASGYVGISSSITSTIVNPDLNTGSLTGITIPSTGTSFTDPRDNKTYLTVKVGSREWFRQNISYWSPASYPYHGSYVMENVYGRYYTWTDAQTVCPDGWRLPSDADWRSLAAAFGTDPGAGFKQFDGLAGKMMANAYFNGERLWEYRRGVNITDESLFSALPTSFASIENGNYRFNEGKYGLWWTSDQSEGMGVCRYLHEDTDILFSGTFDKNLVAAPVRCVRNL